MPPTAIVPRVEDDTPGNINDQTIPRHQTSFLVYGPFWSIHVEHWSGNRFMVAKFAGDKKAKSGQLGH